MQRILRIFQNNWFLQFFFILAILTPMVLLSVFSYTKIDTELTNVTFERRQTIAHISALLLKERLDRLVSIGVSFASRVQFRDHIEDGQWEKAIQILAEAKEDFPTVERLFLADVDGVLMAGLPNDPTTVGVDFSYRDWYMGVSKGWKPYVSEAYKRRAHPQYNIVSVAIPITNPQKTPIGILVLQIKLDTFLNWSRDINASQNGYIYITDQKGQIVAHPFVRLQDEIVSFEEVDAVKKSLEGKRGIELSTSGEGQAREIVAYESIVDYGWTVVFVESIATAFEARTEGLRYIVWIYGSIFLFTLFLIFIILRSYRISEENATRIARETKESLRGSEERYKRLIETTPDAIFVVNLQGVIEILDPQAVLLYGYEEDSELIGKDITSLIAKKDVVRVKQLFSSMLHGETLKNIRYTSQRKTGEEFSTEANASLLLDKNNTPQSIIIVVRDITDRESNLQKAMELASIVESSDDAIIGMTLDGTIRSWNRAAQDLYGYSKDEIAGHSIFIVVPPEQANEEQQILESIKRGKRIDHFETKRIKKGGHTIDVSLTLSPIHDEQGNVIGVSKIARNISDRKQIEQTKSDFFWMATHQLRTPLSSLRWNTEILLVKYGKTLTSEVREKIEKIRRNAETMIDQVKEILAVSRMQLQDMSKKNEDTDIKELLQEIIKETEVLQRKKNVTIEVTTRPEVPSVIHTARQRFKDILLNIITNAIKYNREYGKVIIQVGVFDGKLQIVVKDTGIGIPKKDQAKIFERFFRATNVKDSGGTGLGLALVKLHLESYGGTISFVSEENVGSAFTITLPID